MNRLHYFCLPRGLRFAALLSLAVALHASAGLAQQLQWVPLDGAPPGTPAELRVDESQSSLSMTKLDLLIHGFYVQQRMGPDQQLYYKVTVPGMGSLNQQGAPDDCSFCHAAPPASEHAPDFMKDHGQKALVNEADCLRCHHDKQEFCDKCHELPPASHYSGRWRYTHGADAKDDPANCEACHDQAYCDQCHAVSHPSGWQDYHGAIAKKGPSACLVCHPQGMCDACHEQNGVTP